MEVKKEDLHVEVVDVVNSPEFCYRWQETRLLKDVYHEDDTNINISVSLNGKKVIICVPAAILEDEYWTEEGSAIGLNFVCSGHYF